MSPENDTRLFVNILELFIEIIWKFYNLSCIAWVHIYIIIVIRQTYFSACYILVEVVFRSILSCVLHTEDLDCDALSGYWRESCPYM